MKQTIFNDATMIFVRITRLRPPTEKACRHFEKLTVKEPEIKYQQIFHKNRSREVVVPKTLNVKLKTGYDAFHEVY